MTNSNQVESLLDVGDDDPTVYTARTGVKLRLQKVSAIIISDVARRMKAPKPPQVFIEDKGRAEENPNDPDYLEALERFQYDRGYLAISVYLSLGTTPLEIPDGMTKPEDDSWIESVEDTLGGMVDLEIPRSGKRRYFAWLKYVGLTEHDLPELSTRIMRLSGVLEEADVQEAVKSFRSAEGLDTADGIPPEAEGGPEDRDGAIANPPVAIGAKRTNSVRSNSTGTRRAGDSRLRSY